MWAIQNSAPDPTIANRDSGVRPSHARTRRRPATAGCARPIQRSWQTAGRLSPERRGIDGPQKKQHQRHQPVAAAAGFSGRALRIHTVQAIIRVVRRFRARLVPIRIFHCRLCSVNVIGTGSATGAGRTGLYQPTTNELEPFLKADFFESSGATGGNDPGSTRSRAGKSARRTPRAKRFNRERTGTS